MKVFFLFATLLWSFNTYALRKSCSIDQSVIENNPALVEFRDSIVAEIEKNDREIAQAEEAKQQYETVLSAGFDDPSLGQKVIKEADEASYAEANNQIRATGTFCTIDTYRAQAYQKVKELCGIASVTVTCNPWGASTLPGNPNDSLYDVQTLNDEAGEKRKGIAETLKSSQAVLSDKYMKLVEKNNNCENSLQETLLSGSCKEAYESAFRSLNRAEIVGGCRPDDIQSLARQMASDMGEFATNSCEIMGDHVADKGKERMLYNRLQKYKKSIACLNHIDPAYCREKRGQRSNASSNAPIPAPRRPR